MTALPLADFSAAEAHALGLIEVQPDAPESLRERATNALITAWYPSREEVVTRDARDEFRRGVDAVLDVLRGPSTCTTCGEAQAAIERVTALAGELDTEGAETKALGRRYQDENRWVGAASCEANAWASSDAARRIRRALRGTP